MMLFKAVATFVFLGLSQFSRGQTPAFNAPKVVSSLNIDAFMGRWFQVYASYIPKRTYQQNAVCIVTDFSKDLSSTENLMTVNFVSSVK
jgi:lipocalin